MIVDNSPDIADALVVLLKRKGFSTVDGHGRERYWPTLGTTRPDLLLFDIMMNPMDS